MKNFTQEHQAYIERLNKSLSKVSELELARKRLTYLRWKVAENLDKLLFEFETNVKKNDAGINWCPDNKTALETLNKHLKNYEKISFFNHIAVRQLVNDLEFHIPVSSPQPDLVVIGAKFVMANTGNFYAAMNSFEEYESLLKAKKIVVVAGIDSLLASQADLITAKQLYAIYETGNLNYTAEIMSRPGRTRGTHAEVVLMLTDLNKSRLLENPAQRPLFSLLNFTLPPVCPMQKLNYDPSDWNNKDTLSGILHSFIHGSKDFETRINGNYGLRILNQYLPYDIDLYDHVLEARASMHKDDKNAGIMSLFDTDKSSIATHPKKFGDSEKFRKYSDHNFFGKNN